MIAVQDIAYAHLVAPDLDRMETFLLDFGLHRTARDADTLYMRGAGPQPYVHVSHSAASGFGEGLGFQAASLDDLHKLAAETGTRVEKSERPGGGSIVALTDPGGYRVDVIHGQEPLAPLPMRQPHTANMGADRTAFGRRNATLRQLASPSTVLRMGHLVLRVPSFKESHDWYSRLLGLRISDSAYADEPENTVFALMRCGLGQAFTDHHTLGLAEVGGAGIDHIAYEVLDWDDLVLGHEHLKAKDYPHALGIGRHVAGSQIFDYWRDPAGVKIEHWTDGDQVNDDYQGTHEVMGESPFSQWGPPLNMEFFA